MESQVTSLKTQTMSLEDGICAFNFTLTNVFHYPVKDAVQEPHWLPIFVPEVNVFAQMIDG